MSLGIDPNALEKFLAVTSVSPRHRAYKGFEDDLLGKLNPTTLLDQLFWHEKRWLDFPEFVQLYWQENQDQLKRTFHQQINTLGFTFQQHLAARLYRTQFGFLTEYHAAILADAIFAEHGCMVDRSPEMDRLGVDFTVNGLDMPYHIHIFVDTERSWAYRQYKRTQKASNHVFGCHIDFPYKVAGGCLHSLRLLPNGFGVYQRAYVEHLCLMLETGQALARQLPYVDCRRGLMFEENTGDTIIS